MVESPGGMWWNFPFIASLYVSDFTNFVAKSQCCAQPRGPRLSLYEYGTVPTSSDYPDLESYILGKFERNVKCELDSLHASEAWDEGLEWESYQFGRTVFSTSAGILEHELE